jgi:hypothetical protein
LQLFDRDFVTLFHFIKTLKCGHLCLHGLMTMKGYIFRWEHKVSLLLLWMHRVISCKNAFIDTIIGWFTNSTINQLTFLSMIVSGRERFSHFLIINPNAMSILIQNWDPYILAGKGIKSVVNVHHKYWHLMFCWCVGTVCHCTIEARQLLDQFSKWCLVERFAITQTPGPAAPMNKKWQLWSNVALTCTSLVC